jgi:3-mercaptopyruvate sulfurtransferase SseA
MCKLHDETLYVFAVNMREGTVKATFELTQPVATTQVQVLGEDRSLQVVDGRFQDEFTGYAVHVYRVGPR